MEKPNRNYAFIDGSFNNKTKTYGCGGFLVDQYGKKTFFKNSGQNQDVAKMRNVAGEILGAMHVVKLAYDLGMKELTIFHDYEGIAAWPLGKWKCTKKETKYYSSYIKKFMDFGMKIYFFHVKSHNGNAENEEADRLARAAVELL